MGEARYGDANGAEVAAIVGFVIAIPSPAHSLEGVA